MNNGKISNEQGAMGEIRNEELGIEDNNLYTLMPLVVFKGLAGVDDREDKLARFCLVTVTFTIEHYCKRCLLRKRLQSFYPH